MPGLWRGATGQDPLRRRATQLHLLLRALRPGAGSPHDHPGRGPALWRQLGRDQGDPETRPVAPLRPAQAQAPPPYRHRRDRHRQGAPLPDGGPGPGQRRGGLRRRRQGGQGVEALLETSPAYREAVSTHLPKAKIVFDRFHVMRLFNEKLSDLRRALHREATDVMQKQVLKGTRWLLLKASENLDQEKDEKSRLNEALALNQSLAVAYYLVAGGGLLPEGGSPP